MGTVLRNLEVQVGTGVFISLCSPDVLRRASFEINLNQWFTKDKNYANGELIWFSTIAPSLTWKIFPNPKHDALEVGASVGVFRVTSSGLDEFGGFIAEPIRADIHAPTAWKTSPKAWQRIASIVTLRAGGTIFLSDFGPEQLAPADHNTRRVKGEWIWTYGVFFKAFGGRAPKPAAAMP